MTVVIVTVVTVTVVTVTEATVTVVTVTVVTVTVVKVVTVVIVTIATVALVRFFFTIGVFEFCNTLTTDHSQGSFLQFLRCLVIKWTISHFFRIF